ncbi:MAG: peptidase S45 [Nocardioides sp.]|nr:peptidase S45 [Nocardioides sp.]
MPRPRQVLAPLLGLALGVAALAGTPTGSAASAAVPRVTPAAPVVAVTAPGATPDAAGLQTARQQRRAARYDATVRITEHGIPHVTARTWGSLGYGSGYAAAESSICTLYDTIVTGRGLRSYWFGPGGTYDDRVSMNGRNRQIDTLVVDLHNRKVVERLLRSPAGPGKQSRRMVAGYVEGVNTWLRRNDVTDPACRKGDYLRPNVTSLDLWYGVYLANLLASTGVFVKEIADADPPTVGDPGLPDVPVSAAEVDAAQRERLLVALGRDPESPFGSNATAVGGDESTTGRGMLLGNPHFPWVGRYRFTQQHLTIPGKYDVAGASLIGSPAVNIGFNSNVAWSHTVSTAYRFTPYEYRLVTPTSYLTTDGVKQLEHRTVRIRTRGGVIVEDLWRTDEGYVADSPATFMGWSPVSVWAIRDANAEHLRTIDTFLEMGKATSVRDLLRRQDAGGGMPWVNTTAADRRGTVLYADHSVVPHVTNAMKNRCLTVVGTVLDQVAGLPGLDGTRASGDCAWGTDADAQRPGMLGPRRLPEHLARDWVMNANDSFWLPNDHTRLEGFPTIIGCERCERTMRTRMVSQYVVDQLRGDRKESPATLRSHEHANRVRAAEVMSQGGALDAVCDATGETEACAVLAAWDRRSDADSVGTHLFEEFVSRVDSPTMWLTPFDADDPLNTPRDLNRLDPQVVQAMQDGIDAVRDAGVAFDAPWGTLQVSADRGAPPYPLGGGLGNAAGNANALASRLPVNHRGRFRPITYGSSHIQAVSFRDRGKVVPSTILTYSQSENPRSPYSSDQTKLFSQEKWVRFPWTRAQVRRHTVDTWHLVKR